MINILLTFWGRFFASWVNLEGKVTEVEILSGVCQDIRDECYRILSILPDFSPGIQNGKPVNVLFTLPIKFRLE